MAKKGHLYQLFDAHTKDLNELLIEPEEIIVCPICLTEFTREAIDQKLVNDGHVWPKLIRKKSKRAGHIQVILCKKCNERSSQADNQMQIFEKVKEGDKTGELYGTRLIEFLDGGNDKPAQARVNVQVTGDNSIRITGRIDENKRFLDSSPTDQKRLEAIFTGEKKVGVTIHQPKNYKPGIVPGAWITSAYLMAFYSLGYRYIMQPGMQVVRDYIINSFENESAKLPIPNEENFALENFVDKSYPDPLISFVFPPGNTAKVYLLVAFLDVAVRLPFLYNPSVFIPILKYLQDNAKEQLQELTEKEYPLELRIKCTKTEVHDCLFDLLMGKLINPSGAYNLTVVMPK
jgi:hypothetical protein